VKYELKWPDGVQADQAHADGLVSFSKELKLSPEQAQALLNRDMSFRQKAVEMADETRNKNLDTWEAQVKSDKELGGSNLDTTLSNYRQGVKTFDKSGFLTKLLEESGYGSHPEMVRIFSTIGKMVSSDSLVIPGKPGGENRKSAEELLYPTSKE
jgi:hypothetical protein